MNHFTFRNLTAFSGKAVMLLALLLCGLTSFAQVTTSTIVGLVTDGNGEGLIGATVVATHVPSGTRYGTATNALGRYTLPAVRVGGPFTVTVSYTGFEPVSREGVFTTLGTAVSVDLVMRESSAELGEVTITGSRSDVFSFDRTGAGTNIKKGVLESLPTISRSIQDFTRLTPQSNGNNLAGRNNLYNNISIDGSLFNNSFGLAGTVGGQTNSQPISLDAVAEIQVSLAPYDVREAGFTGGGINAVTRSGDNEFRGSVFGFLRSDAMIGSKVDTTTVKNLDLDQKQFGFRLGGPIVKDKIFFFVNAELDRRTDPGSTFFANRGTPGDNISAVSADSLDQLSDFLRRNFNYETGPYEGYNFKTESDKILAKLDFNLSEQHKLGLRYNRLRSLREIPISNSGAVGGRQPNSDRLPFKNASYIQNNNLNSYSLELNSIFGSKFSNTFIAGWNSFRDFRESGGGVFPLVDILSGSPGGTTRTTFGYEPFTPNNQLDQDVYQLTNNFSMYLGKHTVTVGGNFEYFKFSNGFTPRFYGDFRFASFADFYNSLPAGTATPIGESTGAGRPVRYELTYSAVEGVAVPLAELEVGQIGAYLQDEFQITRRFKLTAGLRVDVPYYPKDLARNPRLDTLVFAEGRTIDVSKFAKATPLWSPRLGFNYNVLGNDVLQIRGGTGVFTGRIPFVWLSNQASNNGLLFGSRLATGNANNPFVDFPFSPDVTAYIPQQASVPATVLINSTDPNFKFPQVWRSNLAVDWNVLKSGYILTVEGMYTKDVNAIYHRDLNFRPKKGQLDSPGDKRDIFNGSAAANRINSNITNAIELTNTNQGYSYFTTVQLQKEFGRGFFASAAYTYGESKDLTSNLSAIAATSWTTNQIPNSPNEPVLSWSNYDLRHRVLASASYRFELFNHIGVTLAAFWNAQRGGSLFSDAAAISPPNTRYSFTYGGDLNGDGIQGNDLIYIPRDRNDINLVSLTTGGVTFTPDEQWTALNAFIEQDEYLSANRGRVMERNGGVFPWFNKLDIRGAVDLFTNVGGKQNKLQFTCDILNFGNMLNPEWGVLKTLRTANPIQFAGYETGTDKPRFTFNPNIRQSFVTDTGLTSRWQMQLGLRYIFN
ncbi:MAG: TonB-dependent receptor [Saprospiraceae bacterium]|nr:TonB-dependent receptor [Saprospiraceae bacterium]